MVFDIVNYLLDNNGYGYSTDIAQEMLRLKPRRYTSREVIGILRNRPMFRHAQSKERRGGIRWRLDLLSLKKYLHQKGYEERADARNLHDKIRNLKWRQMLQYSMKHYNLIGGGNVQSDSSPDSDDGVVSEVSH